MNIAVLLFDNFETLDVFGPVEIFGRLAGLYSINFYSLNGGKVSNKDGVTICTKNVNELEGDLEIFLIPGGQGTRTEIRNGILIDKIKEISNLSNYVLTVCTGSALLAGTGLLDNRQATTNKRAFSWVISIGVTVRWNKNARWVVDGKYYTSSGVSAGMDMALGFIADRHEKKLAKRIADEIEYHWTEDENDDTFKAE